MMNKLGTFKLQINYGVKSVSDYLFHYVTSTLSSFIDTGDEDHSSRYYESYQCRFVLSVSLNTTNRKQILSNPAECDVDVGWIVFVSTCSLSVSILGAGWSRRQSSGARS
jgi:hypothetical protein